MSATFDVERHRRERLRRAEQRVAFLDAERRRLERLLALALRVAAGRDCCPLALLDVLADVEQHERQAEARIDQALGVLRATGPTAGRRAA